MTKIVTSSPAGQFVLVEPLKKDFSTVVKVSAQMQNKGFRKSSIKLAKELLRQAGGNMDLLGRAMLSALNSGTFVPGSDLEREFISRMKK
jgi:hypothetical protein